MSKAYSSNLTLTQWELLQPLIPVAKKGGRPREVDVWEVLNAIFYVLTLLMNKRQTYRETFPIGKRCIPTFAIGVLTEHG